MRTGLGERARDGLVDELARVVWDAEQARTLVLRAGFPPGRVPGFRTAQVFWARVVEDAANGMLMGGVQALVSEAVRQYPGNEVFARYRAERVSGLDGGGGNGEIGGASSSSAPASSDVPTSAVPGPGAGVKAASGSASRPGEHDVFLSHCSADKPAVEAIARRLRDEAGLRPFLDKWHLVPGESWIAALERALAGSTTVAVFFGPQGKGAWQEQETQLALVLAAEERGKRVIPVLLPGARKEDVEGFMRLRTWLELGQEDGFGRLVAGITGRAPGAG